MRMMAKLTPRLVHGGQVGNGGADIVVESDNRRILWHTPPHTAHLFDQRHCCRVAGDAYAGRCSDCAQQLRDDARIHILFHLFTRITQRGNHYDIAIPVTAFTGWLT